MKNYLNHTLLLTGLVLLMLITFSFINNLLNNPFGLKKIDLLADVRQDKKEEVVMIEPVADTTQIIPSDSIVIEPEIIEIKPSGPAYLEDYSVGHTNLQPFFHALQKIKQEPVRIAFFGDSFIEGDILCGSFRDTLQTVFGGNGVGYVPMASEVAQFRMSIRHSYEGWQTYSMVGKKSSGAPLGFSGYCFVPLENNLVRYQVPKKASRPFNQLRLFYNNHSSKNLKYTINDSIQQEVTLVGADSLQELTLDVSTARSVDIHFEPTDSILVYGGSFENNRGIFVDNFAMRSHPGTGLSLISDDQLRQFNRYQNYKLIILQYGLNVVSEKDSLGYVSYTERMITVIQKLKSALPTVSIVLLGVSDRSSNQDGTFATIPAIPVMRDAQRKIAQRSGIAFWDMYTAMGGSGTMVKYVQAVPPLAAKDYTHLTYFGGKKIAKKLADALLHEFKKNGKANTL